MDIRRCKRLLWLQSLLSGAISLLFCLARAEWHRSPVVKYVVGIPSSRRHERPLLSSVAVPSSHRTRGRFASFFLLLQSRNCATAAMAVLDGNAGRKSLENNADHASVSSISIQKDLHPTQQPISEKASPNNSAEPKPALASLTQQDVAADEPDIEKPVPSGTAAQQEAENNYKPKTAKFWLVVLSAFVAMFLVALDRTILSTAIPRITDDFKSLGDIGWYGSAYMLTTAAFQLLFGRIYRFYNLRWVFLCCVVVFEVGSAICGAAPSSSVFIFGRAIAGLGSAGIMTGSMMIIIPMVPLHKRPMFQCESFQALNVKYQAWRQRSSQPYSVSFSASPPSWDPCSAVPLPSGRLGGGAFT